MLTYNNKVLKKNEHWINYTPPPPIYHVYTSGDYGTVSAVPDSGTQGTEVTLYNYPIVGSSFISYSVTGATLKDANHFDIVNSDVYVHGNFVETLSPYTIRLRYAQGTTPPTGSRGTLTLVSAEDNIWDLTYEHYNWNFIRNANHDLLEIIDANIIGVRYLNDAFTGCENLYNVNLFDTSTITTMSHMFYHCYALQNVPLFNTTNVHDMTQMFQDCFAVKSGALALYRQASSQANPPTEYQFCFRNCGRDTTTGAAELAQIPSDWK